MRIPFLVLFACLLTAADELPLFDGATLAGWKAGGDITAFRVVDGAISADGPAATLYHVGTGPLRNFELSVEVMTTPGADAGVYFHAEAEGGAVPAQGFEVQVRNHRSGAGHTRDARLTGSLMGLRHVYKAMVHDGDWTTLRIAVRGKGVQVRLGDTLVVDYVESDTAPVVPGFPGRRLGQGLIALECHGPGHRAAYRNLRLRPLADALPDAPSAAPPLDDYQREIIRLGALGYPLVNHHIHLKGGLTLDEVLAESRRTGIFFGIAANCGLKFPITDDAGMAAYLASVRGAPAFIAMQAEGREWVTMFSPTARLGFDYVFTDAMTVVDDQGRRMRLWMKDELPPIADPQAFIAMLADRSERIVGNEPIDIWVNPTYLPDPVAKDYETLWTPARMQRLVDLLARRGIAVEINDRLRWPSPAFLKLAKAAGCRFTFGTNNTGKDIGRLDHAFAMIRELDLKPDDIWLPRER